MAILKDSDCWRVVTSMPMCTLPNSGQWSQSQGLDPPFLVAARQMAKMVGGETMGEGVPSGAHFCSRAISLMEKVA